MQPITPANPTPLLKGTLKNLFYPPEQDQYTYFARAADLPFTKGDSITKAAWAADAAMLCYARYGSARMADTELSDNLLRGGLELRSKLGGGLADWNAPGTQAFFAACDEFAILAFRGTEVDDPADEHSDLDILLVHEPVYAGNLIPPLGHLSLVAHLFSLPCLVHKGFQSALNDVWDNVYDEVADYRSAHPDSEICLTGHSLGGALALLAYSRLADPNTSVYTIGCPRVGDTAFRSRVAACPGKGHFRCVNFNDLVTHVPLESALYSHAPARSFRFDDNGILSPQSEDEFLADIGVLAKTIAGLPADFRTNVQVLDQLPAPPGLVDHSPARYCTRLWDCAVTPHESWELLGEFAAHGGE